MSGLSGFGESFLLTQLINGRFISLHVGDPGDAGASEVAGGSYIRQATGTFVMTGHNPTIASNNVVIQFPPATIGPWGTVTHFGLWDADASGSFFGGWPVKTPKVVDVDDVARWDVGQLRIATDEVFP